MRKGNTRSEARPESPETVKTTRSKVEAIRRHIRTQKAAFDEADRKGQRAMAEGDYAALGEAIQDERAAIEALIRGDGKKRR